MDSGQLISVRPEELIFEFELEKPAYCNLKVVNNTAHHVAFKVKTTSPKKYFVCPNTNVVRPWDSCTITVTLQAQREYPQYMQCMDKFLLQSTKMPPTNDRDEITPYTFNNDWRKVIEECWLRVVYISPQFGHINHEGVSGLSSTSKHYMKFFDMVNNSSVEEIQMLQRLREDMDATLQQNKQLQEVDALKNCNGSKNDTGFSLLFLAFTGLIGLLVGIILSPVLSSPSTR